MQSANKTIPHRQVISKISTMTNTINPTLGGIAVIAFITVLAVPTLYHTGAIDKNMAAPAFGTSFSPYLSAPSATK